MHWAFIDGWYSSFQHWLDDERNSVVWYELAKRLRARAPWMFADEEE